LLTGAEIWGSVPRWDEETSFSRGPESFRILLDFRKFRELVRREIRVFFRSV